MKWGVAGETRSDEKADSNGMPVGALSFDG
jgi:hypothetical protein